MSLGEPVTNHNKNMEEYDSGTDNKQVAEFLEKEPPEGDGSKGRWRSSPFIDLRPSP